jgi:predicted GIY-YIG superfamily endonuclease
VLADEAGSGPDFTATFFLEVSFASHTAFSSASEHLPPGLESVLALDLLRFVIFAMASRLARTEEALTMETYWALIRMREQDSEHIAQAKEILKDALADAMVAREVADSAWQAAVDAQEKQIEDARRASRTTDPEDHNAAAAAAVDFAWQVSVSAEQNAIHTENHSKELLKLWAEHMIEVPATPHPVVVDKIRKLLRSRSRSRG